MYGKFFASTFSGSMVGSGPLLFSVWSYIIASAKSDGCVEINPILLAAVIGKCTPEQVQEAIHALCQPDSRSRSKTAEGRRLIQEGEFLYRIVNFPAYRNMRDEDDRKNYMRDYMRRRRAAESSASVNSVNPRKPALAEAEEEAEAESVSLRDTDARASGPCDASNDVSPAHLELAAPPTDARHDAVASGTTPRPVPRASAFAAPRSPQPLSLPLTGEAEPANDAALPWARIAAVLTRILPHIELPPRGPRRDRGMKAFWRDHGRTVDAFERLAERVSASDFLMARNGHSGRNGRPFTWSWIFDRDERGWRHDRVLAGDYDNDRMAFILEKAARRAAPRLRRVIFSNHEVRDVDPAEQHAGAARYRITDELLNGLPLAIDYAD